MGKASKIRKRRKVEGSHNGQNFVPVSVAVSDDESDQSDSPEDETKLSTEDSINCSIQVLQYMSRRTDRYDQKTHKSLRIGIFPLIELQKNKFFEEPMILPHLPDDEYDRVVTPQTLALTITVAKHFINNPDIFADEESKSFRRALHPLVVHTYKLRTVGNKTNAVQRLGGEQSSVLATLSISTISNRISNSFRNKDYAGVLNFLHQVTSSATVDCDEVAVPKLGSLQRWVRDCDLTNPPPDDAHNPVYKAILPSSLEAFDVKEMSLLLLHAVLRVTNVSRNKPISPINTTNGQPVTLKFDSNSVYPYKRAVKILFPSFNAPRPWPSDCYFEADRLKAMIAEAAQDYQSNSDSIIGSGRSNIEKKVSAEYVLATSPSVEEFYHRVRVVSHVPGHLRRPPTPHDLNVFMTSAGTICYSPLSVEAVGSGEPLSSQAVPPLPSPALPAPSRHDVPHVPGAMLLTGVLTPLECKQFIVAAERLGYTPDAVDGIDNVVWLADDSLLNPIYERVQSLLPATLEGHQLVGLNARLRLFRYYPGAEYRPHIDGAWPGSGLLADGTYTDDAFDGDRHSRLTFLVYLNDGFTGGATTYFLPGPDDAVATDADGSECSPGTAAVDNSGGGAGGGEGEGVGHIEVRKVEPQLGAVLVFPHGSASGSLVHEGSAVGTGVKYVIRTDVLYTSKPVVTSAHSNDRALQN